MPSIRKDSEATSDVTLDCTGVDRVERVAQFTGFEIHARLEVPAGANVEQTYRLLVRAEEACLITNSLNVKPHLDGTVEIAA